MTDADPRPDGRLGDAIARAQAGDMNALHFLYVRYADGVYGHVNSIVRDDHAAEDVTQDVFVELLPAIKKYEQRAVPFAGWLLRVARNAALDHLRSRRQIPCEDGWVSDAGNDQLSSDRLRSLRAAFDSLREDQREVLILRHVAGLTPGEIADVLGKTESTVHGLHHRARRAVKEACASSERRRLPRSPEFGPVFALEGLPQPHYRPAAVEVGEKVEERVLGEPIRCHAMMPRLRLEGLHSVLVKVDVGDRSRGPVH
jgi:RNA polymerase sigma-70 factor (ECF subfamily)